MRFSSGHRFRRNSTIWALSLGLVGLSKDVHAEALEWTYDFSSGSISDDWNHNTNNPAVSFADFLPGVAHLSASGNPTFQSTAIHENSYGLGVGDSLRLSLAWTPFNTKDSTNGNNEVFQLGLLNLAGQSWAGTADRFTSGDGFWLSGREIASTAPTMLDEWGTQSLNLWLHTDDLSKAILDTDIANSLSPSTASAMELGLGLGNIEIDSFRQNSDGSVSATFLDIDLELTLLADGSFDYGVEIFSYEWTLIGSDSSWLDEGLLFSSFGNRAHQLDLTSELHPAIGFLVADSSQLGVSSSKYSQAPTAVPEPVGVGMALLGLGCIGLGRRRLQPAKLDAV